MTNKVATKVFEGKTWTLAWYAKTEEEAKQWCKTIRNGNMSARFLAEGNGFSVWKTDKNQVGRKAQPKKHVQGTSESAFLIKELKLKVGTVSLLSYFDTTLSRDYWLVHFFPNYPYSKDIESVVKLYRTKRLAEDKYDALVRKYRNL